MSKPSPILERFAASTRGVAAIEFAAIAPILAIIFLSAFDGARAIAAYMKARAATYVLASITNQYTSIASSDMTSILGASSVIMAPYNSVTVAATISQITINSHGAATIEWSATQGGTARAVGSSITPPTAMVANGSYLIFAEITATYTPLFGLFGPQGITLSDNLYVTPRNSTCIIYTVQSSTC